MLRPSFPSLLSLPFAVLNENLNSMLWCLRNHYLLVLAFACLVAGQLAANLFTSNTTAVTATSHHKETNIQTITKPNSMPMSKVSGTHGIEYYVCSQCKRQWHFSQTALARAKLHVLPNRVRRGGCSGATIRAHKHTPSNQRVGGGSSRWDIPLSPSQDFMQDADDDRPASQNPPWQAIQQFPPSIEPALLDSGRIDQADLEGMNASQPSQNHSPGVRTRGVTRDWSPTDITSIFQYCRQGLINNSSQSPQKAVFDELINSGPPAQKYNQGTTYWTADQLSSAITCPADITCFGVNREEDLQAFQDTLGATPAEQRFMDFCHTENLPYGTTRRLYKFIVEAEVNHEDYVHKDYQQLHNTLKNNIPEEYKFQMVPLTVGKLYGCRIPVTNESGDPVQVPVRNLWKTLCLLFADPRYRDLLDMHPEPVFQEGPNGKERVYCGWASCEWSLCSACCYIAFMPCLLKA